MDFLIGNDQRRRCTVGQYGDKILPVNSETRQPKNVMQRRFHLPSIMVDGDAMCAHFAPNKMLIRYEQMDKGHLTNYSSQHINYYANRKCAPKTITQLARERQTDRRRCQWPIGASSDTDALHQ